MVASGYRQIGGVGNNLVNPSFDSVPGQTELRIVPRVDGELTDPTLPNPRTISNNVSSGPAAQTPDDGGRSAWLYVFGQFVDHDLDKEALNPAINCDVVAPTGDPTGKTILLGGSAGPDAVNTVAGFLDLSQVYGSDTATAVSLRNADGTMKTSAGGFPPIVDGQFVSGDVRVQENPELTAVTGLWISEHNSQVAMLRDQHPGWSGDRLYNEARKITIAEYQHIVYSEFLPCLLGPDAIGKYTGYKSDVNAQVTQEFSTAAFRVGHSQVSDHQEGIDERGNTVFGPEQLSDAFFNTPAQTAANGRDALLCNLGADVSQRTDVFAGDGLRNLLAAPPQFVDLIAIDIQRERDLGLGTLNQTREALGLDPYASFADVTSDTQVAAALEATYGSVDKLDLFIGGLAEDHASGAAVGPTFQAIIADQFTRLRDGDRFFWQNENFTPKQRATIGQTTLGTILERNTDIVTEQQNVFLSAARRSSDVAPSEEAGRQLVVGVDDDGAVIAGGPDDDTIVAGKGLHQVLTGGDGADTFVFVGGGHQDAITDFNPFQDTIRFQPATDVLVGLPRLHIAAKQVGADAVVTDGGNQITLQGVSAGTLTAANFVAEPGVSVRLSIQGLADA